MKEKLLIVILFVSMVLYLYLIMNKENNNIELNNYNTISFTKFPEYEWLSSPTELNDTIAVFVLSSATCPQCISEVFEFCDLFIY